ncbi:MATE family efflux transporter [uncultured Bacteroides sp.]|uniref:MATE family efflux transporter n=1 Tax=uncultured Bacteroides sp. TaxID=162156 RepID=UPI002AABE2A9|nr:MATE family efflux transporter [uncultured Bacteroides sp.]
MNKKILQIAIPSIISNITVPLLGLIDVAIVGHLGAAAYIGAVAVGGMLFNVLYWSLGFLRMGTSGMTSQAYGKRSLDEVVRLLIRSLTTGISLGLCFILLQYPLQLVAFHFIGGSEEVETFAALYFRICIWGAPAVLALYSFMGWFIGMQNSRFPMYISIVQNIVNILVSLCLVFVFDLKIAGVAWGTLIAQYAGVLMAILLWRRYYARLGFWRYFMESLQLNAMLRFFSVNSDIFLRTLCLVAVTVFFTSSGAKEGDVLLAVNTLLMQLFTLFSYIMDGFAYAGEALGGRYVGARDKPSLHRLVTRLFLWGGFLALLFTLLYGLGGNGFLRLLTNDEEVILTSGNYLYWALAIPLTAFAAFLWDGLFIGATATRYMLLSMLVASAAFFGVYYLLHDYWGNHALWAAFIIYLTLRGVMQTYLGRRVLANI